MFRLDISFKLFPVKFNANINKNILAGFLILEFLLFQKSPYSNPVFGGTYQEQKSARARLARPCPGQNFCLTGWAGNSLMGRDGPGRRICTFMPLWCSVCPAYYICYVGYRCTLTCPFDSHTCICFRFP